MFKKFMSVILTGLLVLTGGIQPITANTRSTKEEKLIQKLKAGIATLGTGPEARIEVTLRDKTKLKGYVSEVGDDSFVIVDAKTNVPTRVPYPQVKKAKGNNLSQNTTFVLLIVGLVVFLAIAFANDRGRS